MAPLSVPTIGFFSNGEGAASASLTYHLSWMFSELGINVLVVDLDPHAKLTRLSLDEWSRETLEIMATHANTMFRAIEPLIKGGDAREPDCTQLADRLSLISGDIALATLEDQLAEEWFKYRLVSIPGLRQPPRLLRSFWQAAQWRPRTIDAELILIDAGSNLDAISRAAMLASDFVIISVGTDRSSLAGLSVLGPALNRWRNDWAEWRSEWLSLDSAVPPERMEPLGYVASPHTSFLRRRVSWTDWLKKMPAYYHEYIACDEIPDRSLERDAACPGILTAYISLTSMGQEAHKPIFSLTPADGAIGAHAQAATNVYRDFKKLAVEILVRIRDPRLMEVAGLSGGGDPTKVEPAV